MRGRKRVVLAGGTFDILHVGHLKYLAKCKEQGDILVVCIAGDARTRRRKGLNRPIIPAIQRAEIVANLKMVDFAFISNSKPFSEQILHSLKPNVLVTSCNEPSSALKQQFMEHMYREHPEMKLILTRRSDTTLSSSKLIKKMRVMKSKSSMENISTSPQVL
jgi:rfaE bifunctional protein nucleotidyltransferase chain/domain